MLWRWLKTPLNPDGSPCSINGCYRKMTKKYRKKERSWLADGMSMGSAAAFMITGPATKITNLGAMKIVLGWKQFILYILFTMAFAWGTGMIVDLIF